VNDEDQLRAVEIPDEVPSSKIPADSEFSMCAGEFVEVYSAPSEIGIL
jgi:carnosine N-methyltransferase